MRLIYAKLTPGNFGDELNAYLWPRLFRDAFDTDDGFDFLGIGTILSPLVDTPERRKVVFGAGAGYWKPPRIDESWRIHFVRGPLTAALLGLPTESAITDAAYCLPFLRDRPSPTCPSGRIAFMPHHKSEPEVDWRSLCVDLGWDYASPTESVDAVLSRLRSARMVVTEAMHGAIVADLYRVPWVGVRYGFRSLDFKWQDWCASMSMEYRPIDLPPLLDMPLSCSETVGRIVKKSSAIVGIGKKAWKATPVFPSGSKTRDKALKQLDAIAAGNSATLSPDTTLRRNESRLWEQVERFRLEQAAFAKEEVDTRANARGDMSSALS